MSWMDSHSFLSSTAFLCLFHMTANGQEILESHACFLSLACDDLIVTAVMKRHAALEARRKKSEDKNATRQHEISSPNRLYTVWQ